MLEEVQIWIHQQITQNDVFAGLVGGSLVASVLYSLRSVPSHLRWLFLHQWTVELVVRDTDESFIWINEWLANHPHSQRSRRLAISTRYDREGDQWTVSAGFGRHLFWHSGRLLLVERELGDAAGQSGRQRETFKLRMLTRDQQRMRSIIQEARDQKEAIDRTDVYTFDNYWERSARKLPRPLESVVLPEAQKQAIVSDLEWFEEARDWYIERGIPYRRGLLLTGPPGCGKTSLAAALANHLRRPIYVLNIAAVPNDAALLRAMNAVPARALLLMEDVDAAKASAGRKTKAAKANGQTPPAADDDEEHTGITLSGLLNCLDGVIATEGRILVMTTNHPDGLDPALVRPGRVDRREEIGPLGAAEAAKLYRRFYPQAPEIYIGEAFSRSAAELQGIFMAHADDPKAALEEIAA